ncbi:MAG: hypothetical protein A2583_02025 [Bdellovibrionales bacterium RIFOXYD1_FULL_53_11]|nr:MAG: hypothetical protein A2583_02025 [Bdellovibrionales bacterium RIFOXYD1_FULL_53_11]
MPTPAALEAIIKKSGISASIETSLQLPGDASTRKYYRIFVKTGGGALNTLVLMSMEPFEDRGMDVPFLAVQRHLAAAGVDVPSVLAADPAGGLILLEDLGDATMLKKLQESSGPDLEKHLYEKAIDALVQLQLNASPQKKSGTLEAFTLSFDVEKLLWEIRFTIEHFLEKYLKRTITADDRQTLETGFGDICSVLATQPTVLAHRDYHSRNIMILPPARLVMIDFQDARLGPAQYDLASLLRDSYYQLDEDRIDRLIDYYITKREAGTGSRIDGADFRRIFDLMSVQRNFKAIGSFASFVNLRNNHSYLKFVGNTFENIRRTLQKYPEYARLREVLSHYYYF